MLKFHNLPTTISPTNGDAGENALMQKSSSRFWKGFRINAGLQEIL